MTFSKPSWVHVTSLVFNSQVWLMVVGIRRTPTVSRSPVNQIGLRGRGVSDGWSSTGPTGKSGLLNY